MSLRPKRNEVVLAVSVALVLLFVSWLRRGQKIAALEAQLAAKPKIQYVDREKVVRRVVQGPVRVETRTIEKEGLDHVIEKVIEKVVYRDAVVSDSSKEKAVDYVETPVCPPPARSRTRYAGLVFGGDGYGGSWVKGARAGINVFDSWDLGGNFSRERSGATVLGGDVVYRW